MKPCSRRGIKCIFPLLAFMVLAFGPSIWGAEPQAELLLVHGHIYTANPHQPWAQAIAIGNGKILAVGSDKDLEHYRDHAKVIDLAGRMVMPGVIDSHIHFLEGSMALEQFALDDLYTVAGIQQRIKEFAAAHPNEPWLLGRGWLYDAFKPSGLPDKKLLDEIVPDRPVVVDCYDGHSIWVNSKALALAQITRSTPDVKSGATVVGIIVRDPNTGEPTGVLKEQAARLVRDVIPAPTHEEQLQALRGGLKEANRHGVTSVVNASGALEEMDLYAELRRHGELTVRMKTALMMKPQLSAADFAEFQEGRRRFHDEWLSAGVIKAFMDGVVESHTAAMLVPYSDDPHLSGALNYTPEQFRANVIELDRRHFQVMTHAIGDRAVRTTLDAYQAAEQTNGPRDRRYRIEHIETINPADIPRFGQLHVIAGMQPYHCYPEPNLFNVWARNIGSARLPYSFVWHDLASDGATLAFGSDWPVVSLDPCIGIQNAVTREDDDGKPAGGWIGKQKLTLDQALTAYTRDAAYTEFEEATRGSLEPGKLADVIVLSQDLFKIAPLAIHKTQVQMTIVGGRVVYQEGM
jgi:predicted amidohydrolase YtcJ